MIKFFKSVPLLFLLVLAVSCSSHPDAQTIITQTIENHGGEAYQNSRIEFTFRDVEYTAKRQDGRFLYTRTFPDSLGGITDSLTNRGFSRTIAGKRVDLTADEDSMFSNSINAVIYFAELPFKLNDEAVNKELLGTTEITDEPYYEIKVSFDQQGGGTDYQDTFMYWIHRENYTMDYLAYRFHVDGGGTRFRQAQNVRMVNGIRFADYHNFGGSEMQHPLEEYDSFFEADTLDKVSEINLEHIEVELLGDGS